MRQCFERRKERQRSTFGNPGREFVERDCLLEAKGTRAGSPQLHQVSTNLQALTEIRGNRADVSAFRTTQAQGRAIRRIESDELEFVNGHRASRPLHRFAGAGVRVKRPTLAL